MTNLKHDLKKLCEEENTLKASITSLNNALADVRLRKQGVANQLAEEKLKPSISDHALIRYCERALNFDFDEMRDELLSKKVKDMIDFGAESIMVGHGKFKIVDKRMVTFIGNK